MKPRQRRLLILAIVIVAFFIYARYQSSHEITLTSQGETTLKSSEIQPVTGSVKLEVTDDTDVVFTDVDTGETYKIDYATSGKMEKIKLEKGKWYSVEAKGDITLYGVNARVE